MKPVREPDDRNGHVRSDERGGEKRSDGLLGESDDERRRSQVVDDVSALRDVFRDALAPVGFEIDTAATAAETFDRLATRKYAVIVADCVMPGMVVLDWLAALRGRAPVTPLVVCSGTVGDELRSFAADFGAVAVLEKPFTVAQLLAAVRLALAAGGRG